MGFEHQRGNLYDDKWRFNIKGQPAHDDTWRFNIKGTAYMMIHRGLTSWEQLA